MKGVYTGDVNSSDDKAEFGNNAGVFERAFLLVFGHLLHFSRHAMFDGE
jgi:hypothetical protein